MTTQVYKKLILIFGLISLTVLAGCASFGFNNDNNRCTAGDNCRFYQGTDGIISQIDNPPRNLYFYYEDIGNGNSVDIDVRVRNDGASDSIGAVFLSGLSTELYDIALLDERGREEIIVNAARRPDSTCFFTIRSLQNVDASSATDLLFSLPFYAECEGVTAASVGSGFTLSFSNIFQAVAQRLGWSNAPDLDFQINAYGDGSYSIDIGRSGLGIGGLLHGKVLMTLVSQLRFDEWFGHTFELRGDHPENPGGDRDFKTFRVSMAQDWPHGQDSFRQNYQINTCFAYTTFVSPMVCIDRDPASDELKVCNANRYEWSGSQGGPVAVTSLSQYTTRREVVIDIEVQNRGRGVVWDVGYLERCSPYYPGRVRAPMKNKVYVGQAFIGDIPLDCMGSELRLDPNTESAQFTCRYPLEFSGVVGSAYEVPLRMELWYGYEENIQRSFTVRRR